MKHTPRLTGSIKILTILAACLVMLTGLVAPASADPGHDEPEFTSVAIKLEPGADLAALLADYDMEVAEALVPSRGLYMLQRAASAPQLDKGKLDKLIKELEKERTVVWVEVDELGADLEDDRYHAWPTGLPTGAGSDPRVWTEQQNLDFLELDLVHRRANGQGITVAILDTGADMDHPYLVDHLVGGGSSGGHYDYIDDDSRPAEAQNGIDDDEDGQIDESFGHGTHTGGLVALIAPAADLLIYRVLDSDGEGNPYVVAEAVNDAVAAGADVINISFGMDGKPKSKVLKEAFKDAEKQNVSVVAAVGNDGRDGSHFPSEEKAVIGVGALAAGGGGLARFSNHGKKVLVAAPGENVVSTLPGGGFGAWSGTSMAAPIVAGQVALIRGNDPDLKVKKVAEILGKATRKLDGSRKVEKGLIDILRSMDDSGAPDALPPEPQVSIRSTVNGQVGNGSGGPVLAIGSTATLASVVSNVGEVAVSDIALRGDDGSVSCPRSGLEPGQSMTCSSTLTVRAGEHHERRCVKAFNAGRRAEACDSIRYRGERPTPEPTPTPDPTPAPGPRPVPTVAKIGDSVSYLDGGAAAGVKVDLFRAGADGLRSQFLGYTKTDSGGNYGFKVERGCYILVFIAPDGHQFVGGNRFRELTSCVDHGEADDSVDAVLRKV